MGMAFLISTIGGELWKTEPHKLKDHLRIGIIPGPTSLSPIFRAAMGVSDGHNPEDLTIEEVGDVIRKNSKAEPAVSERPTP